MFIQDNIIKVDIFFYFGINAYRKYYHFLLL